MSTPQVLIHRDGELLAKAVAARLVTRLVDVRAGRGRACLVLMLYLLDRTAAARVPAQLSRLAWP